MVRDITRLGGHHKAGRTLARLRAGTVQSMLVLPLIRFNNQLTWNSYSLTEQLFSQLFSHGIAGCIRNSRVHSRKTGGWTWNSFSCQCIKNRFYRAHKE